MPVDKPKKGETKDQYLAYCIPAEINAGKEKDVAAAICISTYERDKMKGIVDTKTKVMARIAFDSNYEGINLAAEGEDGPCWSGYEQIGTKDKGGVQVPNCVPIKE